MTDPDVVEQAKGFLREIFDVSVEDASDLLRLYAHARDHELTRVSQQLVTEPKSRPAILAAIKQMMTSHC